MRRRTNRRAFTLIELLIVVAIIAILAAIAVPNFIEAQARGKVSRALADMRSCATAIESYAVDHNRYPAYGNPRDFALFAGEPIVYLPVALTTPVAYASSLPPDPFPGERTGAAAGDSLAPFFYMHGYEVSYLGKFQPAGHVRAHFSSLTGSGRDVVWTTWSYGPDRDDDHGTTQYDPTNGTASDGDLMRFGP